MKASNKLKLIAACMTIVGVLLIILSVTVFKSCDNCGKGWEFHRESFGESYSPNIAMLFIGIGLTFFSFPVWVTALRPQMTKMAAELQSETMDVAGDEIKEAADKTLDVFEPIGKRVVKNVSKTVKEAVKGDSREELEKAQNLYNEGLITKEEYEAIRKKILGL